MSRSYVYYFPLITVVVLVAFGISGINPVASLKNFFVCMAIGNVIAIAVVSFLSSHNVKPVIEGLRPRR
jgi:uncharacterized membrane protein YccC